MPLAETLLRIVRNFAAAHFLSGFFLFVIGWRLGLSPGVVAGVPIFCYGLALAGSRKEIPALKFSKILDSLQTLPRLPLAVITVFFALNFFFCLLPPGEHTEADALLYHLTLPWQYYLRGEVGGLEWALGDKFPLYLQMAQLPFTVLMFPWVVKLWNLFVVPGLFLLLWKWGELLEIRPPDRAWMIALFSSLTFFGKQFGTAMFDLGVLFYLLLGFFYLARSALASWGRPAANSDSLWGILLLGMACAQKSFLVYAAVVWGAGYFLWKIFRRKDDVKIAFSWSLFFLPALTAAIWLLPVFFRNWQLTGNPFFPMFLDFFGTEIDNPLILEVMDYVQNRYGYGRSLLHFFGMPFAMLLPVLKFDYWVDAVLGLFFIGALVSLRKKSSHSRALLFWICGLLYGALFFMSHQSRYYYLFWVFVLLLGTPWVVETFRESWRRWLLLGQAALAAGLFFFFHRDAVSVLKYLPRGEYLEKISFSYVWDRQLPLEPIRQLCLRPRGNTIGDLFYLKVPLKLLDHHTTLFSAKAVYAQDCDLFMLGSQFPRNLLFTNEGRAQIVSREVFLEEAHARK